MHLPIPFHGSARWLRLFLLLLVCSLTLSACEDDVDDDDFTADPRPITQFAAENGLTLLVDAINRAGSGVSTLLDDASQPITLFAPTNEAFRAYLGVNTDAQAQQAINNLDPAQVADLLRYHVAQGNLVANTIPGDNIIQTLYEGETDASGRLFTSATGSALFINDARVVEANLLTSNDIIHLVDRVLAPPTQSIPAFVTQTSDASLLLAILNRTPGLLETLSGAGPFTVFAPNNDAFVSLLGTLSPSVTDVASAETYINGLSEANVNAILVPVVQAHVVPNSSIFSREVPTTATQVATVNPSQPIRVQRTGNAVTVIADGTDASTVILADQLLTNGVVHVIDQVLTVE